MKLRPHIVLPLMLALGFSCHLVSGVTDLPFDNEAEGGTDNPTGPGAQGGTSQNGGNGGTPSTGGTGNNGNTGGTPANGGGGTSSVGGNGGNGGIGGMGGMFGFGELGGPCGSTPDCTYPGSECCTDDACDGTCAIPCPGNNPVACPDMINWSCQHDYCLYSCAVDGDCIQPGFVCHHGCTVCESKTTQGCL